MASQQAVVVAELRGKFVYFDEWLTMSARMAAETGDTKWTERYEEARPQLDAAITQALTLATPAVSAAFAETTAEASRGLTEIERAAFARGRSGDRSGARALLESPEFNYLEAVYVSGIEAFGQDLQTLADARSRTLDKRAWTGQVGLSVLVLSLVAAVLARRGRKKLRLAAAHNESMARTDRLTNLPNRHRLLEVLKKALAERGLRGGEVALLLFDLDRFKIINDLYGPLIGDKLLQLIAQRLQAASRPCDLVARLGGDDFALLATFDQLHPATAAEDAAAQLAHRLEELFSEAFEPSQGVLVQLNLSIGVAVSDQIDEDPMAVIRRADVALSRAKADGRGRIRFFEPTMDDHIKARALLESELRRAIADDRIIPHFQPLVEIDTGRLIGFEMLARWPHAERGFIPPIEFIPIAEEIGLITQMTACLLQRACSIAAAWPSETLLACNISPLQLRDRDLPTMISNVLQDTGLAPHRLELEITESALVGDLDLARELLCELKALGVRLALDDFGTGYSSLKHLKMLPFDKLKIDASFVNTMLTNVDSRKIVGAVVGLGHSLGLITVAEGVEDAETTKLLREFGCDIGQGWLFGRPQSSEATSAMLIHRCENQNSL